MDAQRSQMDEECFRTKPKSKLSKFDERCQSIISPGTFYGHKRWENRRPQIQLTPPSSSPPRKISLNSEQRHKDMMTRPEDDGEKSLKTPESRLKCTPRTLLLEDDKMEDLENTSTPSSAGERGQDVALSPMLGSRIRAMATSGIKSSTQSPGSTRKRQVPKDDDGPDPKRTEIPETPVKRRMLASGNVQGSEAAKAKVIMKPKTRKEGRKVSRKHSDVELIEICKKVDKDHRYSEAPRAFTQSGHLRHGYRWLLKIGEWSEVEISRLFTKQNLELLRTQLPEFRQPSVELGG